MSDKQNVYIYGHSFPARLLRSARQSRQTISKLLSVELSHNVFVEGHPGLTYDRIFSSGDHHFKELKRHSVDLLCIDLGSNDLCGTGGTSSVVVQNTLRFLESLESQGVCPRNIVILSVIRRSKIARPGQVSVTTFNHRVKRYNALLKEELGKYHPTVKMYRQRKTNRLQYISEDGCHLTDEGLIKYGKGLREVILSCKK